MIERSTYGGPELRDLLEEHDLTMTELAEIMQTDRREVYRYLKDERRVLNVRWRLLMLELGIERPAWTEKRREKRALAEFVGVDEAARLVERARRRR